MKAITDNLFTIIPGLAAIAAILVLATWPIGLGVFALAESILRGGAWLWLALIPAIILIPLTLVTGRLTPGIIGGILTILALIATFAVSPYVYAHAYTTNGATEDKAVNYRDRAPWVVANNYASRDQGEIVGSREDVHLVPPTKPDPNTSRYTALVKAKALLGTGGYEAVQVMNMPNVGTIPGDTTGYCTFPENMGKRLGATVPWKSLNWAISAQKPLAHWSGSDVYAYCDGEDPVVVVPLWKYQGFYPATRVPNGAAVYTPEGLSIRAADDLDTIQGPTYPRSIAEKQRDALTASGTIGEYYANRVGYETTAKDSEDTNTGNTTEFTLTDTGGDTAYVTPLTPRGSSQSVTGLGTITARQDTDQRAPYTVNTNPNLPATSTLATAIRESSVKGDNAWTTRWASGMSIYEILPARDGHWVASIGQGQAVSYRADISPTGEVNVTRTDAADTGEEPAAEESVKVEGDKPLDQMSDEELVELIDQAVTELKAKEGQG